MAWFRCKFSKKNKIIVTDTGGINLKVQRYSGDVLEEEYSLFYQDYDRVTGEYAPFICDPIKLDYLYNYWYIYAISNCSYNGNTYQADDLIDRFRIFSGKTFTITKQ